MPSLNNLVVNKGHNMTVFSNIEHREHEQIVYCYDKSTGLKAIIAIHDTTLGPSLGGTRLLPYESEEEALHDVLRLSRGMTYKSACANLQLGGGKAVIIADPANKSEAFFRAYGRFVDSLGGRYITAEDMNTNVVDMDHIRLETSYVAGVSPTLGGSGNPSPMTALGTFHGIQATVKHRLGKNNLRGLKVSVQGAGAVGRHLCHDLYEAGAILYVQDIHAKNAELMKSKYNATIVTEQELYDLDVDVYAPCARGSTLNANSIARLKATVIAGCANNQLEDETLHGKMLLERNILYAPDYVINAGGIINVANELYGYNKHKVEQEVAKIAHTLSTIFVEAEKMNITTQQAANHFAERRIESVRNIKVLNTKNKTFFGTLR